MFGANDMNLLGAVIFALHLKAADTPWSAAAVVAETVASSEKVKNAVKGFLSTECRIEDSLVVQMVADCLEVSSESHVQFLAESLSDQRVFQKLCWTECEGFRQKYYSHDEQEQMYVPFLKATATLYWEMVRNNDVLICVLEAIITKFKNTYVKKSELDAVKEQLNNITNPCCQVPHNLTKSVPAVKCLYRESDLNQLKQLLSENGSRLVLASGFGGVGKTEIARKLFHELQSEYTYAGWVNYQGDLKSSMLIDFLWPQDEDTENRASRIYRFLQNSPEEKLIVIDNVSIGKEKDAWLEEISGMEHLTILLTSRQRNIGQFLPYDVEFLLPEQSVELFVYYYTQSGRTFREEQRKTVEALVTLVQYHTLSVEILAKSAKAEPSLEGYLEHLKAEKFSYPKLKIKTEYSKESQNMAEYLRVLFDLNKRSPEEMRVLRNFALMPSKEIPAEVEKWIQCEVNVLQDLCESGWLELKEEPFGYYMHPLIKETILLEKKEKTFPAKIGDEFVHCLADDLYLVDHETYKTILPKLDIAYSVLRNLGSREDRLFIKAYTRLAVLMIDYSLYRQAEECFSFLFILLKSVGLENSPEAAEIYNHFGVLRRVEGRYDSAAYYLRKSTKIYDKNSAAESLEAAKVYNNLGIVCQDKKWYKKAEKYYVHALNIREAKLPPNHYDIGGSYNNLGLLYMLREDLREHLNKAEEYSLRALEIKRVACGEEDPSTAGSYNNLGDLYIKTGEFDKALINHNRAFEIRKICYGPKHRDTGISYYNTGEAYLAQNNYELAMEKFENALEILLDALGQEHPYVIDLIEIMRKAFPHTAYAAENTFEEWMQQKCRFQLEPKT